MSLTKHKEGSLRELWTISFPLMLSSLSMLTMIFADRLFLARYSVDAHNAAVTATTLGWAFIFGWVLLASISEVFVAQYNGAGEKNKLGAPVWQMIWASLLSVLFFLPLSLFGTNLLFDSGIDASFERDYFKIMVLFGPFYALHASVTGFFIGQGKTHLVTWIVIIANTINIALDALFIFGLDGLIEPMGVKGAAIATSLATVFQFLILFVIFLIPKNQKEFGTFNWKFNPSLMKDSLKVGSPTAIFVVIELSAYAIFYALMKDKGNEYITITGICQSMLILFMFFSDGINKATTILTGNLIGAKRSHLVSKVIISGLKLNGIFLFILVSCFTFGMPLILDQFLPYANPHFIQEIKEPLRISLIITAIYIFFECVRMQFSGVLTAAGDTLFLLIAGTLSVWGLMVIPAYLCITVYGASVEFATLIWVVYSALACCLYSWRMSTGKWKTLKITS